MHAGRLELRVGKILEAWPHPESDKLWCEKIDVGEPEPRLIASGLRAFYSQVPFIKIVKVLFFFNEDLKKKKKILSRLTYL